MLYDDLLAYMVIVHVGVPIPTYDDSLKVLEWRFCHVGEKPSFP